MQLRVMVKNTFIDAVSHSKAVDSANEGDMRRTSSCPSLFATPTTSQEHVNNEGFSAVWPLAKIGDWADIASDSDEEDHPSVMSTVGPSSLGFRDEVDPAVKVGEETPPGSAPEQESEQERTPLSCKASAFVPFSLLSGRASALAPCHSQMAGEPPHSKAPDVLWKVWTETCTPTTVMLRNLPCRFTRKDLIRALDQKGFGGAYNFVYLPIDFASGMSMGYAFVNLNDGEQTQHFIQRFDGQRHWPRKISIKICQATLSHTQGLEANVTRFQNSPVMSDEVPERFKPALFVGAQQVPFPKPTRELPPVHPRWSEA
jgi:hypothetical protein